MIGWFTKPLRWHDTHYTDWLRGDGKKGNTQRSTEVSNMFGVCTPPPHFSSSSVTPTLPLNLFKSMNFPFSSFFLHRPPLCIPTIVDVIQWSALCATSVRLLSSINHKTNTTPHCTKKKTYQPNDLYGLPFAFRLLFFHRSPASRPVFHPPWITTMSMATPMTAIVRTNT